MKKPEDFDLYIGAFVALLEGLGIMYVFYLILHFGGIC